jgi:outer membrane protein assembly factor BamB
MKLSFCMVIAWLATCASICADWPAFRGPASNGVSSDADVPDIWAADQNVAWKVKLPGRAWSSPIVWGERIFVTTAVTDGEVEAPKKGLYFGGERKEPHRHSYSWELHCYSLDNGALIWKRVARSAKPKSPIHIKNTYASETPVTDGKHVIAYFGSAGLYCFDIDGTPAWSKDLGVFTMLHAWGTASSPVLYGDRLFVQCDNENQSYLLALDKASGEQLWRADRDGSSAWSTPFVWQHGQRTELVTCAKEGVRSYDPTTGALLWRLTGMSRFVITTPFAANGLLYINSGYVGDKQKPIYAIKPGAAGDISLTGNQTSNDYIAWSDNRIGSYNPTPLVFDGRLYVLYDRGIFSCFDARSGKEIYKARLSGQFTTSPWSHAGKIFCANEDGETSVIQPGDSFKLLHINRLDEMFMASPAIAKGALILRGTNHLYCIRK